MMNIIRGILSDLRLAIRTCTRTPSFTITASLTLAVGIAATSTIFAMVNGVLLRSLPFGDPDRLVALYEHHRTIGKQGISAPDYEDWRNYVKSLQGLAAYTEANYFEPWLTGDGGPPEKIKATLASHNLLTVLDVHPQLGRDFTRSDDEGHENSVAIISDRFWRRRFQALPTIIGRSLALDGRSYTVIGVLPPSVRLPDWADVWIPLSNLDSKTLQRRQSHVLNGVGRLKSGVSMEHLASELDTIVSQLRQKYPLTNGPTTYECRPLRDDLSGELRSPLLALSLAVILVLVVASCNVASLLQTRYLAREAEFAIKRALGARASTILRQLVLESWVLSLVGAIVGLVMTAGVIVVVRKLSGGHFVRADQLSIDASVVMFAMCLAVLTSVIAAFGPVAQLVRSEHASMTVLKSRAGTPVKRRRAFVFLAGQIAMSMAVVVVAGLLVHDFRSMVNKKLGFKRDDLVTLSISLRPDLYSNDIVVRRYYDNLLARIRAIPGVAASALVSTPLFTRNGGRFWIDGVSEPEPGNFPVAQVREISPEYFAAMGIALVRGRYLDDSDQAPGNVVINQTLARTYFPNDSAIGRFIILGVFGSQRIKHQVVGVVADATDADLSSKALPTFYLLGFNPSATALVRSRGGATSLISAIRQEVDRIDPGQPITDSATVRQLLARLLARQYFAVWLFGTLSAIGLGLASLGVYGVLSNQIAERRREIGIRLAIGAGPVDLCRDLVGGISRPVVAGLAGGVVLAVVFSRLLRSVLPGVDSVDLWACLQATSVSVLAIFAGTAIPLRRALITDPTDSLRDGK